MYGIDWQRRMKTSLFCYCFTKLVALFAFPSCHQKFPVIPVGGSNNTELLRQWDDKCSHKKRRASTRDLLFCITPGCCHSIAACWISYARRIREGPVQHRHQCQVVERGVTLYYTPRHSFQLSYSPRRRRFRTHSTQSVQHWLSS